MCLHQLVPESAWRKDWIPTEGRALHLSSLEVCAREDPDRLETDIGDSLCEICV